MRTHRENLISYLENFKYILDILSKEKNPALSYVVIACNTLVDQRSDLNDKLNRSEKDEVFIEAFQGGRDKIFKHYQKCNGVYCISLIHIIPET